MKQWFYGVALSAALVLAGCAGGPPPPADASVNGITKLDRDTGGVEFSISAFDRSGELLTSGTISGASATVDQPGYSARGEECERGSAITSRGPLTAALTLDASGSMANNDPEQFRNAGAKAFVDRMSSDDQAIVTSFEGSRLDLWTPGFISDKAALYLAIDQATYIGGDTPLWDAAAGVIRYMEQESPGSNNVAVIFTDGADTGSRNSPDDVIVRAQTSGIRVFMIGLGTPSSIDTYQMSRVASDTGGFYDTTAVADGLERLFTNAFNESKASGCIGLIFEPVPTPGTSLSGGLSFRVNGRPFKGEYEVTF